jgi:hypothetical protein
LPLIILCFEKGGIEPQCESTHARVAPAPKSVHTSFKSYLRSALPTTYLKRQTTAPAEHHLNAYMNPKDLSHSFYTACPAEHTAPTSAKWLALSPNSACPICVIRRITQSIRHVQDLFAQRGGIFESRGFDRPKPADHQELKQCWRVAKIHAATVVDLMEDLRSHGAKHEDLVACDEALKVWNAERSSLWKLPGHSYDEDEKETEMSEEARMSVSLMLEVLEMTVKKLSRDLDEEDRRAGQELSTTPACSSQSHTAEEGEDVRPTRAISPRTPFRSPAPSPPETRTPAQSSPECHSPSPTPPEASSNSSSSSKAATPTLSILKRKSPSSRPSASTSSPTPRPAKRKRVRYASFAIVPSDYLATTNASPFISASSAQLQSTVQAHRLDYRPRSVFRRTSPHYLPGQWASPAFAEKANTSHYKTSWLDYDKLTSTEVEEGEQESRVATGLKNVSEAWVMRWWLRNVTTKVDLERIKATIVGGVGSEKVV